MARFLSWLLSAALIFFCCVAASPTVVAQTDVHALAAKIDQHYDHLRTLEARFTETYSGAGMNRTESGTLFLKRPGRMRWDYDQPRPKLFLTDGHTAWFYVPGEKQVRQTPASNSMICARHCVIC